MIAPSEATYDITTDIGKVRALCGDTNTSDPLLYDEEIEVFIDLEDTIKEAAALSLETIASRQVLLLKVVKTLDLQVDGAKVAQMLLGRAKGLRDQADVEASDAGFEVADQILTEFAWRENVINILLRENV
jgi:hypothetical protein